MQAIGSDRYLTRQELVAAVGDSPALEHAWDVYQRGFGGYCETGADPLWSRLSNPARDLGTLTLDQDQSVVVLGTGPSAAVALPALREVRARVHVITSPRGAEWLAGHGLTPDLVVVEHQSPLDAHLSVRHLSDIGRNPLSDVPLVAAEARTPAVLLAGVPQDRLFVPAGVPTWGLWPATAVAMAAQAGAARIGLLGVDLGTTACPDPAYAPLSDLLGLLAQMTTAATLDYGTAGARKPGWVPGDLECCTAARPRSPLSVRRAPAPSAARRYADLVAAGRRLSPRLERARHILRLALTARAGQAAPDLADLATELLAWGDDPQCRVDLQDSMGVTLLPRLWRTGIDVSLGAALWRPLMLATHELTGQADRLDARLRRDAA
jgi:hypothetical protein